MEHSDYTGLPEVNASPEYFMLRSGPYLLLLLMILLFLLSYTIFYPERIKAKVKISSKYPTVSVKSAVTKSVKKILIQDNEEVQAGQPLIVMESPARYEDVVVFENLLQEYDFQDQHTDSLFFMISPLDLGIFKEDLATFLNAVQSSHLQKKLLDKQDERRQIRQQLSYYYTLLEQKEQQIDLTYQQVVLQRKDTERFESLHRIGSVADADLEANRIKALQSEKELRSLQSQQTEISLSILELERYLTRLGATELEKTFQVENSLFLSREKLLAKIQDYYSNYLIRSPVSGKVIFVDPIQENELLQEGKNLMTILPAADSLYARLWLPLQGSGKVNPGQSVNIYLEAFPYQRYGSLKGIISSISPIPLDGMYRVELKLTLPLKTSYQYLIPPQQDLYGEAEIITESSRLVERIFYPLRNIFKYQQ